LAWVLWVAGPEKTAVRSHEPTPSADPAGRVVFVVIDALRSTQVIGPSALASLEGLRPTALHGRLEGCLPASTVPCIRTMLEGNSAGYGAGLENFAAGRAGAGAWPVIVSRAGLRVGAASDHTFRRLFEDDLAHVVDHGRDRTPHFERDEASITAALDWLERREVDVVLLHLLELDKASHVFSPGEPQYQRRLAHIDGLLQRTVDALGPEDSLVVVGDHGHDEHGNHNPDTGYLAVGPAYVPGARDLDQPTIALLLAAATGTPLPETYEGELALALVAPERVPAIAGPGGADALKARTEAQDRARLGREKTGLARFLPFMLLALVALAWAARLGSRRRDLVTVLATMIALAAASAGLGYLWGHGGRESIWLSGAANVANYALALVVVVALLATGIRRVTGVDRSAAVGAALLAVPMLVHLPGRDYYASVYAGVHLLAPACLLLLAPTLARRPTVVAVLVALVTATAFRLELVDLLDSGGLAARVAVALAAGAVLGHVGRAGPRLRRLATPMALALILTFALGFAASQVAAVALLLTTLLLVTKELDHARPGARWLHGVLAATIMFLTLWGALGKWTFGSVSFSFAFRFVVDHPVEWVVASQVTILTVAKYLLVAVLVATAWPTRDDAGARSVALTLVCLKPLLAAMWVVGARLDVGSRHQDLATEETLLMWCMAILFVVAVGLITARKAVFASSGTHDR
jgi:hypothetical protein